MNRSRARELARKLFPCKLYGTNYKSFESLVRRDRIASIDLLDHIQYNEPMNQGSIETYDQPIIRYD